MISGTTYVAMPEGASALKLEDPRLPMMIASPGRLKNALEELKQFHYARPSVGDVRLSSKTGRPLRFDGKSLATPFLPFGPLLK